jgi:hypothetical protein
MLYTILNFIQYLSVSGFILVSYLAVAWTIIIISSEFVGFVYALVKKNKASDEKSGENGDESAGETVDETRDENGDENGGKNGGKKMKYETNYETNYESQFATLSGNSENTEIIKKLYIDHWKLPIVNVENAQKIDSLRNLKQRIVHESSHNPSNAPLDE